MIELLVSTPSATPLNLTCGSGLVNLHTMRNRQELLITGSPGMGMDYVARKKERIRHLLGA